EALWKEPADRNVFGLLREFGDAEIASLVAPRPLVIEHGTEPTYRYRAGTDLELEFEKRADLPGKPGLLPHPIAAEVEAEAQRLRELVPFAKVDLVSGDTAPGDTA